MKSIYLLLLVVAVFSSCSSTYYFSSIESSGEYVDKLDNGDFLFDNDSLWIAYRFKGENAPIQVTVGNKMSKPLHIDWQKSWLEINGQEYSYIDSLHFRENYAEEKMEICRYMYSIGGKYSRDSGGLKGEVEVLRNTSRIPPKAQIENSDLTLAPNFKKIKNSSYNTSTVTNSKNKEVKVKRIDFDEDNSPLVLSSHLVTYTNPDVMLTYGNSFYIRDIVKTNSLPPRELNAELADRGDMFYIHQQANNSFWNGLFYTTAIATLVAVDVIVNTALNTEE